MSNSAIVLRHFGWAKYTDQASVYKVEITSVPEKFGVKFMDGQPDLYYVPVAFLYIRTFATGNAMLLPAIPIQQQEVWYCQPIADNLNRGSSAFLVLEPGVVGSVTEIQT